MKKGKNKMQNEAPQPQQATASTEDAPQSVAACWLDSLTAGERLQEDQKMEMRQKKAEVQKQKQELDQRWLAQEEHMQKQASREQARQDKERHLLKQRAEEQGMLEAQEYAGVWYVDLGQGLWRQVDQQFWCKHCEAGMSEAAIVSHLGGERHRKCSANCNTIASSPAASRLPQAVCGDGRFQCRTEKWQMVDAAGYLRCIPCGKCCDGVHESTKEHENRVWEYLVTLEGNYQEPDVPWLAWLKSDEEGYGEGLYLKCLLCKKWVCDLHGVDARGYVGHHSQYMDGSTKQHKKILASLDDYKKDSAFWGAMLAEGNKSPLRKPPSDIRSPVSEKLSPLEPPATYTRSHFSERPPPPELPAGWWAQWSEEHQDYYFYNDSRDKVQWEPPTALAAN